MEEPRTTTPAADPELVPQEDQALATDEKRGVRFLDLLFVLGVGIGLGTVAVFLLYALAGVSGEGGIVVASLGTALFYAGIVAAAFLLTRLRDKPSPAEIGLRPPGEPFVFRTFLVWAATVLGSVIVGAIVVLLFGELPGVRGQLGIGDAELSGAEVAAIALSAVIAASVAEEILFRGLLFPLFRQRFDFWVSALATAFLFAVTHRILLLVPALMVLGFSLAWLRERYNSVYPPILLHALNNALALTLTFTA